MFFNSETDYQSDPEYYFQIEKYSPDKEEQIDTKWDKTEKISDDNELNKISDLMFQNKKIESTLTKYLKKIKWKDINKSK